MYEFEEYLKNYDTIPFEKLPDLELYIDQVTTFLDDKLKNYKRTEGDKAITKTMVNNYTKDKLLPVSNKKKYNKEHLIYLILIYHLKSSLSIEGISKLLNKTIENIDSVESFYSDFINLQETIISESKNKIDENIEKIKNVTNSNSEELNKIYLLYSLAIEIEIKKLLVEKIIDDYSK